MEEEKKKIKLFGATIGEVVAVAPKEEESPEIIKEEESCEIKTTNEEERSKNKEEESCKIIKNNEAMIVVQKECSNKDDRSNDSSCGSSITFTLLGKRQCGIYINDQPNQEGDKSSAKRAKKQNNPRPSKEEGRRAKMNPPNLPDEFQKKIVEMGGSDEPKLVTQKLMYAADVKKDQSRFNIDGKEIRREDFFSDGEKKKLKEIGEFQVPVILQKGLIMKKIEVVKLSLTKWPKPKSSSKGSNNEEVKEIPKSPEGSNVEIKEKPKSSKGSNVEIEEKPKCSKGSNVETKEKSKRSEGTNNVEIKEKPTFVLQRSWFDEIKETDIKEGDVVQLWCFRYGEERKLGFAFLKINDEPLTSSASTSITCSLAE